MPVPLRHLTVRGAKDLIAAAAAVPPRRLGGHVGLEVEALARQPHDHVVQALSAMAWPGGSALTFEPGGQVELSGPCLPDVGQACRAMERDLAAVRAAGITLDAVGLDPTGGRPRVLDLPRYRAMEAYFDTLGGEGRIMMRDTAAFQVNVDAGDERRWRLLHAVGPVLAAAFANSPVAGGRPTGWRSNRLRVWLSLDPTRCTPVGGPGAGAWVDYAMAANVMFVRVDPDRYEPVNGTMTLADWLENGHPAGWPTDADVAYHLTTLFPPVRPRGWLEVRFLDALPSPWWQVAAAALCALLDDQAASETAERACTATAGLWLEAARDGLSHPVLGPAALDCLSAVPEAGEFVERFTARGRCPGDDLAVAAWA
ncbi:MAG: glutamate--cysteine ligase [Acidimicrobiaceae bacterium]|jgi:glutamate--cysteine ligase|nr:glutamate--cysteine ligase [Acidimicrobiaceae bacterium]